MNRTSRLSKQWRAPIRFVDGGQPTKFGDTVNRVTTTMSNLAMGVLALMVLIMCIISFMEATDPRPKFGSNACSNAQSKFSEKNKSLARDYARFDEFTDRLNEVCK